MNINNKRAELDHILYDHGVGVDDIPLIEKLHRLLRETVEETIDECAKIVGRVPFTETEAFDNQLNYMVNVKKAILDQLKEDSTE